MPCSIARSVIITAVGDNGGEVWKMGRLEKIRILNSLLLEEMPEYRQQSDSIRQQ